MIAKTYIRKLRYHQPFLRPGRRCFSSQPSTNGLLGNFNEMIFGIRKEASKDLSELSDEDRADLLERLGGIDKQEAEWETQKSIGEKIAAAKAEEVRNQENIWQKEVEKAAQMATEATEARIKTEMMVQQRKIEFEKWQRKVQEANAKERKSDDAARVDSISVEKESSEEEHSHPILGPALVDLEYKRIHLVTTSSLSTIPVWEKQRVYRHERAKLIATDKAKTAKLGLPGVIVLHEDKDGNLSIVDGQHRVGALSLLEKKGKAGFDVHRILVEVYKSTDEEDIAQELFLEVNKAEPVKLVDMPGVAKKSERDMITDGANKLRDMFPAMFKPSQKCRSPHLNIDNLRDALFAAQVLQRHELSNSKMLVDWVLEQNEILSEKYEADSVDLNVPKRALTKAKDHKFYLGLESAWYYN